MAATRDGSVTWPLGPGSQVGVQRVQALFGGPEMIADHGDRLIAGADHVVDAGHAAGGGLVDVEQLAAFHRGDRQGAELHPRHLDVDAEHGGAVDLGRRVQPFGVGADQLELAGVLQRDRLRHRLGGGVAGNIAVAERLAGGVVVDRAAFGPAGRGIDTASVAAAAATSMMRAAAPAWRRRIQSVRIEAEPPVAWSPSSGSMYFRRLGGAGCTLIWSSPTSSSSAISMAAAV